jgi:hypothetical protein
MPKDTRTTKEAKKKQEIYVHETSHYFCMFFTFGGPTGALVHLTSERVLTSVRQVQEAILVLVLFVDGGHQRRGLRNDVVDLYFTR